MKSERLIQTCLTILSLTFLGFFSITNQSIAAEVYKPLVGIPGLDPSGNYTLPEYINAVYAIIVGLGAVYGVFKIAFIGFKYSLSESIIAKVDARSEISGVLLGLFILLIPYIVLFTINPDLVKMDVLKDLGKIKSIGNYVSVDGATQRRADIASGGTTKDCTGTMEQCTAQCIETMRTAQGDPSTQKLEKTADNKYRCTFSNFAQGTAEFNPEAWGTQTEMCDITGKSLFGLVGTDREDCENQCTRSGGRVTEMGATTVRCDTPPQQISCGTDVTREDCARITCKDGRIFTKNGTELVCVKPKILPRDFGPASRDLTNKRAVACSPDEEDECERQCKSLNSAGEVVPAVSPRNYVCLIPDS